MKCEYCDNEIPEGVSNCPACGATVKLIHPQTTTIPPEKSVSSYKKINFNQGIAPAMPPPPYAYVEKKSFAVFVVLGIFLGALGFHNFYAGYIWKGLAQLLISLISFGLLSFISIIWGFIDILVIRKDAKGFPFE